MTTYPLEGVGVPGVVAGGDGLAPRHPEVGQREDEREADEKAPTVEISFQNCQPVPGYSATRRGMPWRPTMYCGTNVTQKPTNMNQKCLFPSLSSCGPNIFGYQK